VRGQEFLLLAGKSTRELMMKKKIRLTKEAREGWDLSMVSPIMKTT
jgi:hypothetical protein